MNNFLCKRYRAAWRFHNKIRAPPRQTRPALATERVDFLEKIDALLLSSWLMLGRVCCWSNEVNLDASEPVRGGSRSYELARRVARCVRQQPPLDPGRSDFWRWNAAHCVSIRSSGKSRCPRCHRSRPPVQLCVGGPHAHGNRNVDVSAHLAHGDVGRLALATCWAQQDATGVSNYRCGTGNRAAAT